MLDDDNLHWVLYLHTSFDDLRQISAEGKGSSDVSPLSGISGLIPFDAIFLSAPLLVCPVLLLIPSSHFFLLLAQSPAYFPQKFF